MVAALWHDNIYFYMYGIWQMSLTLVIYVSDLKSLSVKNILIF